MSKAAKYFETEKGKLSNYRARKKRRLGLPLLDIEPQSKKMKSDDRDAFQRAVIEEMESLKRGAFRGPIALSIDLGTSAKNPPQAHTIAKNLLDLLGKRDPRVSGKSPYVLYKDDSQIQALAISCRHGGNAPSILIQARPFSSVLEDLELAYGAAQGLWQQDGHEEEMQRDQEWDMVKSLKNHLKNEKDYRALHGDKLYDGITQMLRWSGQRALLSMNALDIRKLAPLYSRPKSLQLMGLGEEIWVSLLRKSRARFQIGELPIAKGSTEQFKKNLKGAIDKFKLEWDWLVMPLMIPVGLEVVVRPSPNTPKGVLHDLDNIVRDYLLPEITPAFDTVTDHKFLIDFEELKKTDPRLAASWGPNPLPPAGTRSGVTRYEVWRIPASTSEPGFLSVAMVAEDYDTKNLLATIDETIDKWDEEIVNKESKPKFRYRR